MVSESVPAISPVFDKNLRRVAGTQPIAAPAKSVLGSTAVCMAWFISRITYPNANVFREREYANKEMPGMIYERLLTT